MKKNLASIITQLQGSKGRLLVFVITVVMFVISAGAPNCPIGIGK